jgi:succinate dehydrogenase / fumarate reductase iron-sulfur subunit
MAGSDQGIQSEEAGGRAPVVKDGHLPVSEFLFDRPGGPSPFGDDLTFPLPVERLSYVHPESGTHSS